LVLFQSTFQVPVRFLVHMYALMTSKSSTFREHFFAHLRFLIHMCQPASYQCTVLIKRLVANFTRVRFISRVGQLVPCQCGILIRRLVANFTWVWFISGVRPPMPCLIVINVPFWLNHLSQTSHAYGLFPVSVNQWFIKILLSLKDLLHISNGLWLSLKTVKRLRWDSSFWCF